MLPETDFLIAAKHYRAGRPRAALEPLARVLEAAPESPRAQALLALCHIALGELDAAERAVAETLRLDAGGVLGQEAALHLAFRRKRWAQGLAHAHAWLALDPGSVLALRNRAIAEAMLRQRARAVATVRQALALAPDDIEVRTHLARLEEFRRPAEALRLIEGVLARAPGHAPALLAVGRLALWRGDWRRARQVALEVLRIHADSRDAAVLLRLARLAAIPGLGWVLPVALRLLGHLGGLSTPMRLAVCAVAGVTMFCVALGVMATTGDAPMGAAAVAAVPVAVWAIAGVAVVAVRLAQRAARRQVRLREDF